MAEQITRHWKLAIVWTLSLIAVGALSSSAQVDPLPREFGRPTAPLPIQPILSGSDVGFRIERSVDGIQFGRVVVRIDGRWVDTAAPAMATR